MSPSAWPQRQCNPSDPTIQCSRLPPPRLPLLDPARLAGDGPPCQHDCDLDPFPRAGAGRRLVQAVPRATGSSSLNDRLIPRPSPAPASVNHLCIPPGNTSGPHVKAVRFHCRLVSRSRPASINFNSCLDNRPLVCVAQV